MLFTGTLTLGCKSYLDTQAKACYCTGQSSSKDEFKNNKKRYKDTRQRDKPPDYGWKDPSEM